MVYIYVLQLEKGKYYIGKTTNPQFRLASHFNSQGSEWTKLYKPIDILELISDCDDYDEDKYTIIYMGKYGIDNVRGGSFVSVELNKSTKDQLKKMNKSANNKCFKCGESGHFAKECIQNQQVSILFDTIMFRNPHQCIELINDIEIIDNLHNYKIKIGDIVLNGDKQYNNLQNIIDDLQIIVNYSEKDIMQKLGFNPDRAKAIKQILPNCRAGFMKTLCELLCKLSVNNLSILQNEKTLSFNDVKKLLITSFNEKPM
jgi:hypothetical protein